MSNNIFAKLNLMNQKTNQSKAYRLTIFYITLFAPIIYGAIDHGFFNFAEDITSDALNIRKSSSHIQNSIYLYILSTGLAFGSIISTFSNFGTDIEDELLKLPPLVNMAISLTTAVIFLYLYLQINIFGSYRTSLASTNYIIAVLPILLALGVNNIKNKKIIQISNKKIFFIALLGIALFVYIKPQTREEHIGNIFRAMQEISPQVMKEKLTQALQSSKRDNFIFTEREIISKVKPYLFTNKLESKNRIVTLPTTCAPIALTIYSEITHEDYHNEIQKELTYYERMGRSLTKDDHTQCLKSIENKWLEARSLIFKKIFNEACENNLLICN